MIGKNKKQKYFPYMEKLKMLRKFLEISKEKT